MTATLTAIAICACCYLPCPAIDAVLVSTKQWSWSHEIGCCNDSIALKFSRHLGSAGAEVPAKFKSNWKSLKISRLRDFTSFAVRLPSAWWIDWPGLSNIYSIVKVALVNVFVVIHVDMKPVSGNEEPHVSSPWHVINVPGAFLCAAKTSCHFYCILWEICTSYGVLNLHFMKGIVTTKIYYRFVEHECKTMGNLACLLKNILACSHVSYLYDVCGPL